MEWVETTAKTVDEAKELALDQLGVLEEDAEFEVLEEPKPGLFGRVRGNARVKARVAPSELPPKQERRRRTGRGRDGGKDGGGQKDQSQKGDGQKGTDRKSTDQKAAKGRSGDAAKETATSGSGSRSHADRPSDTRPKKDREMMPESEQCAAGEEFLTGLLDTFGYEGTVDSSLDDEGLLKFEVGGEGLGLLMGPGLNTLDAIQEVCRNAIQRQAEGRVYGKVSLDVAGARAERTASLEEFVRAEAQQVLDSGEDVIFEVMSRGDRKIVHDVVSEYDGLATESVGEDPRRRVVLRPA